MFNYNLTYNANGNIRQSLYSGNYSGNFSSTGSYEYTYIYDNSNRLIKADNLASSSFEIINGYDKDGNFVGMKRYGSSNNLADDFGYSYFSGTNKLQTIGEGLTSYGYTYDKNGNMTSDQLNRTGSIKYDHRNLMTEIRVIKTEANPDPFGTPTIDVLYLTNYRYDEAGIRVRKVRYKYTGSDPDPVFVTEGSNPSWSLQSDEFYVRDVSGKEIALYSGSSLTQWNIWGLDNVGKINADTTRNYYLKDHLGSIRVVLNSTNTVISAQDYDAWGYPLENRTYNSSAMRYDFTGKERDDETSYDYFGARYYDSRIGRWGGVEPLLDNNLSFTPYNYCRDNPVILIDPNGAWDEYVNESGEYLGSDNDPNSNEVRVINQETWKEKTSYNKTNAEIRKDLQSNSKLLNKYEKGISISEKTWLFLEIERGVQRSIKWVENSSDYLIYYKPEDGGGSYPIEPQTDLYTPVDGIKTPLMENDFVFKSPDYFTIKVNKDGNPDIKYFPESLFKNYGLIKAPALEEWKALKNSFPSKAK